MTPSNPESQATPNHSDSLDDYTDQDLAEVLAAAESTYANQSTSNRANAKLNLRAQISSQIIEVTRGHSLSSELPKFLAKLSPQDRGLGHALLLGTLRQWVALNRLVDSLADKPIDDMRVRATLAVGLYQLLYMDTAEHAAVNETVEAIKHLAKADAAGLVNAILRKALKQQNKLAKKVRNNHSLPNWLAKQIKQAWSEQYNDLSTALRQPAPIFLRVNPRKTTQSDYLCLLAEHDIKAIDDGLVIRLLSSVRITDLPHFDDGWVSVQDKHAALPITLFDDLTGKRVLDACAAPGGKTAQLLEMFHVEHLEALDKDPSRLDRVTDTLTRLDLLSENVTLASADARNYYSDTPYDAILLDAPCTATGVIRRHPDIGLLRLSSDVEQSVRLQAEILGNLWRQLKVGGELIYITCSLLPQENSEQIERFISKKSDAQAVPLDVSWGTEQPVGRQLLPLSAEDGDGFYVAKLIKLEV